MAKRCGCMGKRSSSKKSIWPWIIGGAVVVFVVVPAALTATGLLVAKNMMDDSRADFKNSLPPQMW